MCFFVHKLILSACLISTVNAQNLVTGAGGGSRESLFKVCRKGAHSYAACKAFLAAVLAGHCV